MHKHMFSDTNQALRAARRRAAVGFAWPNSTRSPECGRVHRLHAPAWRGEPQDDPYAPVGPHTFGLYMEGKWRPLKAKEGTYPDDDPVDRIDGAILQVNLLAPILGIEDPRTSDNIAFVGGIRGLGELVDMVDKGKGGETFVAAFAMHPTTIEDVMSVADAGRTMPPKCTWFEPKLRSGLVVHLMD